VVGDSYARILQRARINIGIHSGPSGPFGWQDLVSTRTFEIPACKGFMLHIDNEGVRTLFEPGVEIDVFSTPDNLCEKIDYYLVRGLLRREMIERAYERCVPAYSYDMRAAAIADTLGVLRRIGSRQE
jgi:spore maturation protein CgeB